MRALRTVVLLGCLAGCAQKDGAASARAELRHLGGARFQVVPSAEQLPYCLVFTVSDQGVTRQLTMTRENRSIRCEAGKPVFNTSFLVPPEEGPVRAYVLFSDQRLSAGSIAQQLYDNAARGHVTATDFRVPGTLVVETLRFDPKEEAPPVTGGKVGAGGTVVP